MATLDKNRQNKAAGCPWDKQDMTRVDASEPGTGKSKALMELGKRFSQIRDGRVRIVLRR